VDTCEVCSDAHFATQGVYFSNQMAFCLPTDGRIAGHLANRVQILADQKDIATHPCRSQCGFYPCVSATDYNDIVFLGVNKHR